ncbi:MAG: pilus assembly protein N-terminal domain-containing protein [Alphaproteobacteria bacterium]|nr:pilus assembly protein N-terminal domain-containing protein [Alphaproteobacteria bacterium]
MRRLPLALAALFALAAVPAQAEKLTVSAGQATRLTLAGPVRDVVIGDPLVADVSVVNERTLVILGKRPGVTSLLAFDAAGRPLADRQVLVSEEGGGAITVYRGATNAANYACGAQCTRITSAQTGSTAP